MILLLALPRTSDAEKPAEVSPEATVTCALGRAGLLHPSDVAERWSRARLAPRLALGARSVEVAVPGLSARSIEVFAWLRWPLERRGLSGLAELGPLSARRQQLAEAAAARAHTLDKIKARPRAAALRDQIEDELDAEEALAGLAALGCP